MPDTRLVAVFDSDIGDRATPLATPPAISPNSFGVI